MAAESWVLDGLELNVPSVAQLTNLITNPSFETDTAGWLTVDPTLVSGGTLTRVSDVGAPSSFVGRLVTTATSGQGLVITMPLSAGLTYTIMFRIKRDAGGSSLRFATYDGVSDVALAASYNPSTSYDVLSYTFTAALTSTHKFYIRTTAATVTTFYLDLVAVVLGVTTLYFDGTTPGYQWSGTAHASTSVPAPQIKLMDLTADPPPARRDWITAADSEAAALFRQPLHENRTITMKLRITPQASMNTALDKVGILVDKLRSASATPAGISLVWTPGGATRSCTFNVLAGEITGLPIALSGDGYSWILSSPILTVEMTCHPYWLGTETLTSTASSSTPFVTLAVAGVTGDVPALGRLIVTDTATQSRRHVEWGLEGPLTYNASTSLMIDSDDMVVTGFGGAQATTSGAYDPNASGNNSVSCALYSNAVAVCGLGNLSHVGSFRVKGRINPAYATMEVRLAWRAGDGPLTANSWTSGVPAWGEVDLGTITIPVAAVGTQRWTGQIEARSPGGLGGSIVVDYLTLVPCLDGYGKARATYSYSAGVMTGEDSFLGTTVGNALQTRGAPLGGTWATSGSATDFVFSDQLYQGTPADGIESIVRTTATTETTGRLAILGTTNYTDTQVDVRFVGGANSESGLVARWTDATNHLRLRVPTGLPGTATSETVAVETIVAGVVTILGTAVWQRESQSKYRFRLIAFASGRVIGQVLSDSETVLASVNGTSTVIATGGALASGEAGIWDRVLNTGTVARAYTAFSVSTPPAEPIVLYSGRNMQIRYDDVLRQDSAGTYAGRPQSYRGSRFLVPVGTSRVLVKARRADIEVDLDSNVTDSTQVQVGWTPRGLAVPRA